MKATCALVLVSNDPVSLERGSEHVFHALQAEIRAHGRQDQIKVSTISDIAPRDDLPLVMIYPEGVVYGPISVDDVQSPGRGTSDCSGQIVHSLIGRMHEPVGDIAWLRSRCGVLPVQQRIVLERVGVVEPTSLDDYLIHDGYVALGKALLEMTPQQVIAEVNKSGLQGRGGAGFPTGRKWEFVRGAQGSPKYVICNADESEPGTFKDRLVIEGDPFNLIEAMTIAAYAIGASEGYIYIRGEYKLGLKRLENAIHQADRTRPAGRQHLWNGISTSTSIYMRARARTSAVRRRR